MSPLNMGGRRNVGRASQSLKVHSLTNKLGPARFISGSFSPFEDVPTAEIHGDPAPSGEYFHIYSSLFAPIPTQTRHAETYRGRVGPTLPAPVGFGFIPTPEIMFRINSSDVRVDKPRRRSPCAGGVVVMVPKINFRVRR